MPRILITGDRRWGVAISLEDNRDEPVLRREKAAMERELANWLTVDDVVLIEGEADGADKLSRIIGEAMGYRVERYPAQWDKFGRAAGPIRNQQMLDMKPDSFLAFHHDLSKSKGTADMVRRCLKAGLPGKVISGTGLIVRYPAGGGEPEYTNA